MPMAAVFSAAGMPAAFAVAAAVKIRIGLKPSREIVFRALAGVARGSPDNFYAQLRQCGYRAAPDAPAYQHIDFLAAQQGGERPVPGAAAGKDFPLQDFSAGRVEHRKFGSAPKMPKYRAVL